MIARVTRPTVVLPRVPFLRPVQTLMGGANRTHRGRITLEQSSVHHPIVVRNAVLWPIRVTFSGKNILQRPLRRGSPQPYLQESLANSVLGQPPVLINVTLPRR